jgi:excisionase family DNA binding protein
METCMPTGAVMPTSQSLWTVREAAQYLNCSPSYVYKAAERDILPAIRIGRMLRFTPDAVQAFATSFATVAG